jgi:hypothetical protein|tara:strand:+ start:166 stop:321 length:156 start_codon:yes stop_codon:yes gene_type:complete
MADSAVYGQRQQVQVMQYLKCGAEAVAAQAQDVVVKAAVAAQAAIWSKVAL